MKDGHEDRNTDPLTAIEKNKVLQDSRCFDDRQINSKECLSIITKILFLLNQGEELTDNEGTELFFRVTKLFQSTDPRLRRMVYLILKELKPKESEAMMVTSSLMRDISGSTDNFYKANAIRVLAKVVDASIIGQVERYIKTAVVERNDLVASAAIMAGIRLVKLAPEIIKRWVAEVQEKLNSAYFNTHYHGQILFHEMKKNDPVGLTKFLVQMTKANLKSPLAHCQLIRYIKEAFVLGRMDGHAEKVLMEYLESCLHRSQDMVVFEAAKAICESPNAGNRELTAAFTLLHLYLGSMKPPIKFAAMKTINRLASVHPSYITPNLTDIEPLINDPNRSIASMAISTLLKLSTEGTVERLIKQISSFMNEISDEFKVDIINSIKTLCARMPSKYKTLLSFVSGCLKEDGGFPLKSAVVDCILDIMHEIPNAQEVALLQLAEFIEDCNFELIQCKVLHVIGKLGPNISVPQKLIRFIYNRLILEKPMVRAAAVSCLAKFGKVEALRENVELLLKQCTNDRDDEVRERAVFYLNELEAGNQPVFTLPCSINALERTLLICKDQNTDFSWDKVDSTESHQEEAFQSPVIETETEDSSAAQNPIFSTLGRPQKTTEPVMLTEKTAEYLVQLQKLLYEDYIVLQFNIENTMGDQALENVSLDLQLSGTDFDEHLNSDDGILAYVCPRIERQGSGQVWMQLRKPATAYVGAVAAALSFTSIEYSGEYVAGSYEDIYQIDPIQFTVEDYY